MAEEVKANLEAPLSESFELPIDLEARFYNLVPQSPGILKIFPAIFSRTLIDYMKEQGYLDPFLHTAESFLRKRIRMFLKEMADLDTFRWSGMMQETFYDTVIRPHVKTLRFTLRQDFSYLEAQRDSSHAHEFTLKLLADREASHGELSQTISDFRKQIEELSSEAAMDALTGLQNRKALVRMCSKFSTEMPDEPFAFMIMDMDKFKSLNDSLGHHAGDEAIKQLAGLISSRVAGVRHEDVIRLGGEEFVVLIRNKDGRGELVARKVREILEEYIFVLEDNNHQSVEVKKTISVGLCDCTGKELANNVAYKKADRALQLAKGKQFTPDGLVIEGQEDPDARNRVWVYGRPNAEHRDESEDTYEGTQLV